MEWIWLLLIVGLIFFFMFFGKMITNEFSEMVSFFFLAALIAIILASRDLLLIGIAFLFIVSVLFKKRQIKSEYDFDSGAYGQNLK